MSRHLLGLLAFLFAATLIAEPRRLPTGALLVPVSPAHRIGNFPLALAVAPEGDIAVALLCGYRQQGLQVIDLASGAVTETIPQPSAFIGLVFAPDGKTLFASGGNDDSIHVYRWSERRPVADGVIELRAKPDPKKSGTSYPAGLAVSPDGRFLYAAENLGDALAVVDLSSRQVVQRLKTGRYPYAVAADARGNVYVSIWGGNEVEVFAAGDGGALQKRGDIAAGRHPGALLLDRTGRRLFAASPSTDSIAVIDTATLRVAKRLIDAAPGAPQEGCTPNAMIFSADERRLYVAEADANAVAVFDAASGRLLGRVPTEWYPAALARAGSSIVVLNAKGAGSSPDPKRVQPLDKFVIGTPDHPLGQLDGSILSFPAAIGGAELRRLSARVASANGWTRARQARRYPFKHVIYVIKENRTFDQVLGDLPQADGDPSLTFFPREISPNHHALAERFGIYDRFFVNAEVTAQGQNWSTAGYSGDYIEKTTPLLYGRSGRTYDYEGTNRDQLVDDDDDVAQGSTGFLWDLAAKKGLTYRVYGLFVQLVDSAPGQTAKKGLAGHIDPQYDGFALRVKDQTRIDRWLSAFEQHLAAGEMPALQMLRLPADHTAAASAGMRTPQAYMADNDLALGRMVSAVSHSCFWRDTVFFVLEDDAQSGPDHVDSHRSLLLTISAYNRPGVVKRFVNTTDVLATIEDILGLRALSQFDHFGRPLHEIFAATADLEPYSFIVPGVNLDEKNPSSGAAAEHSELLDFSHIDGADDELFNRILWSVIKGDAVPYPGPTRMPASAVGR